MAEAPMMDEKENREDKPETDSQKVTQGLLTNKTKCDDVIDPHYGWVVVFASFIAHMLFFGVNLCFGVIYVFLLDYYNRPRGETALIGSIPTGIVSLISPLAGFLTNKYGCRPVVISGALIGSSGFLISSLVMSMDYLYLTYGVLVGVGLGLMYLPSKVIVNLYIRKRRGLANAICSSGGGVGVIALSSLYTTLYRHYSLRGMFLVMGAVVLHTAVSGALYRPLISRKGKKSRLKNDDTTKEQRKFCNNFCQSYKYLLTKNWKFAIFVCANFLSALGAFVPYAHLPRKASDDGLPEYEIAWFLPLIGVTSVLGRLIIGCVVDTCGHVTVVWSLSTIACGISLLLCPAMTSFPVLVIFSILFGTGIGVWTGIKAVVVVDIAGFENLSNAFGILQFLQGFATLLGSPLAGWLFDLTGTYESSFYASGALFVTSGLMVLMIARLDAILKSRTLHRTNRFNDVT